MEENKKTVKIYAVAIIAVAFFMITISFVAQMKENQSFKNKISEQTMAAEGALKNIERLQNENQSQKQIIKSLQGSVNQSNEDMEALNKLNLDLEYVISAYDKFFEIKGLYQANQKEKAVALIYEMQDNAQIEILKQSAQAAYKELKEIAKKLKAGI